MLCLQANKRPFWYALYEGKTDVLSDGHATCEKRAVYSAPVKCCGNISPAAGNAVIEAFGTDIKYDLVIVMDALTCPSLDESTVLVIDGEPTYRGEDLIFDHRVKKVARSLNHVFIAAGRVTVS